MQIKVGQRFAYIVGRTKPRMIIEIHSIGTMGFYKYKIVQNFDWEGDVGYIGDGTTFPEGDLTENIYWRYLEGQDAPISYKNDQNP
jgi:hypothetical protein